jgi:ATP-dependent RNA helicase DDX35
MVPCGFGDGGLIFGRIRRKRRDLRIIISSATIDAGMFKDFFERGEKEKDKGEKGKDEIASVISLEGRTFPIDVMYLDEPCEDYVEMAIKTVLDIHLKVVTVVYGR